MRLLVFRMPSQALLHSSHLFHEASHTMASHGISVGDVSIDVAKMMKNKAAKVEGLTGGIEYLCKKYKVGPREMLKQQHKQCQVERELTKHATPGVPE